MKILIYGAGVVDCTYGWQLSKAGCDVTVLVRKGQKELVQKDGIHIICSDFREKTRKDIDIIFKPTVIDELLLNNDFEYIIVSTNKLQLSTILPTLSKSAGKANVVLYSQRCVDTVTQPIKISEIRHNGCHLEDKGGSFLL